MAEGGVVSRWPVLAAAFLLHLTTVSMSYHAGVLHVAMLHTFHQDVVSTALLASVYACLPLLVGPLASLVITVFDCRTCVALAGVLAAAGASSCFFATSFLHMYPALVTAGIGQGLAMTASFIVVNYHFPCHASLVTGITLCGAGLGIFIHPPLLQVLVDTYGLRGAMLVLGAVSLHALPCALAMPPSPFERQRRLARQRQEAGWGPVAASVCWQLDVVADLRLGLFLLTGLGFSAGQACYFLYTPQFLRAHGYGSLTASLVLSATGIGSIPSRLMSGALIHDPRVDPLMFFVSALALLGVTSLLVPLAVGSLVAQLCLAVLFGAYTGAVWTCYSPLLLRLLGVGRVATGVGLYLFVMGVGYMALPPLVGTVYLATGVFSDVFYFTAGMFAVGSVSGMLSVVVSPRDKANDPALDTGGEQARSLLGGQRHVTLLVDGPGVNGSCAGSIFSGREGTRCVGGVEKGFGCVDIRGDNSCVGGMEKGFGCVDIRGDNSCAGGVEKGFGCVDIRGDNSCVGGMEKGFGCVDIRGDNSCVGGVEKGFGCVDIRGDNSCVGGVEKGFDCVDIRGDNSCVGGVEKGFGCVDIRGDNSCVGGVEKGFGCVESESESEILFI